MALLNESVDFKKMDVRMVDRNITRGVISAKEVEQSIAQLPDDAENAEWVSLDMLENDADESELNGKAPNQH